MRCKLCCVVAILVLSGVALWGQAQPSQVLPVPIPGGDLIAPFGLFNQFFPGVGTGFDGLNADPHGITNTNGFVAMGYTAGTATDNNGKTYNVITDIRVYQADYVGAEANGGAGRTKSAKAQGTFVEI
jgi:hypothetical protein